MDSPTRPAHPKPVIGLLGAPGSGKSTVARAFGELGCGIIDADRLAHEALQDESIKQELRAWWGDPVFDQDGRVDRKAVGGIVFDDDAALRRLEALLHPRVNIGRQQERERLFANADCVAVVEDCPLLLETGLDQQCDHLVYVECPFETRLKRLSESRGWDAEELKRREQRQIPLDIKRRSADYVISNGEATGSVREQAEYVLQQISV